MKAKKEDVIHTSAYAEAQNQGIGAASSSTFAERQKIEQNRSVIQRYSDAQLVRESRGNAPKAKKYTEPSQEDAGRQSLKQRLSGGSVQQPATNPTGASKTYAPQIKPNIKPNF